MAEDTYERLDKVITRIEDWQTNREVREEIREILRECGNRLPKHLLDKAKRLGYEVPY